MLVELPRTAIEDLVNRYEEIELSQVDDIMFFRPTCQSVFTSETDSEAYTEIIDETALPTGDAVVAVFDGMPMQNHRLLRGLRLGRRFDGCRGCGSLADRPDRGGGGLCHDGRPRLPIPRRDAPSQ